MSKASDGQRFWLVADQAVVKLGRGGARVRLAPRAGAQFDQRVRLLGARRENAARAMILERAPDQSHAVRHQGGRKRVAGKALERASVEAERQRPRAIDQAAAGKPMRALIGVPPASANFTSLISWVRVLRVTTSHLLAAAAVIPELAMNAGRIVAQIDVVIERRGGVRRSRIGALHRRVTQIGELVIAARSRNRDREYATPRPQCRFGWAPAPRSSISAPVA